MQYKNILVPHAGTAAGNKALEHAKEMAQKHQSKITVLYIVEKIPIPSSMGFSYERKEWAKDIQAAQNQLKDEMHEKLTRLVDRIKKEAIECYDKALNIDPTLKSAWRSKGLAYYNQSKHEKAIECYDKVLGIDPNDFLSLNNKSGILDDLGRSVDVLNSINKALRQVRCLSITEWDSIFRDYQ